MKFVVIEGLDGSGKSTQIKLFRNYLNNKGINYEYLHFPRTNEPGYGEIIARFLRGEMGEISEVDPYLVALMYACDRNDAKDLIHQWIHEDKFVLVDRYVISNIAFQCAKMDSQKGVEELKNWILELEYGKNQLPVPDLNIFLNVPFEFTKKQLSGTRKGNDRDYLQGRQDIHEDNLSFQENVRNIYLSLQGKMQGYEVLNCAGYNGQMLSPDEIFSKVKAHIFE